VARAGLNEQEARARGIACEVTRYDIAGLDRAITDGEAHGFVKVLTVPGRDRILGVTIVGSQAGELLAECVLAMQHGLGLRALGNTLHSHPTLAEAGQRAAMHGNAPTACRGCAPGCGTTTRGGGAEPARRNHRLL